MLSARSVSFSMNTSLCPSTSIRRRCHPHSVFTDNFCRDFRRFGPASTASKLSAVGLDFHIDRGSADGALSKRSRARVATKLVPARNQRAVDLGVHAYLPKNTTTDR